MNRCETWSFAQSTAAGKPYRQSPNTSTVLSYSKHFLQKSILGRILLVCMRQHKVVKLRRRRTATRQDPFLCRQLPKKLSCAFVKSSCVVLSGSCKEASIFGAPAECATSVSTACFKLSQDSFVNPGFFRDSTIETSTPLVEMHVVTGTKDEADNLYLCNLGCHDCDMTLTNLLFTQDILRLSVCHGKEKLPLKRRRNCIMSELHLSSCETYRA